MKFPICQICMDNDILCSGCSENISKKGIKLNEIKTYRRLNRFSKIFQSLKGVEIKRAIDNEKTLLIVTNKNGASKLIGKGGGMVKKISQDLNKQVIIATDSSNIENFTREIFFPVPILGINVIYTPEGEKYIIRIPLSEKVFSPISPETFSEVAYSIFNKKVELVFE